MVTVYTATLPLMNDGISSIIVAAVYEYIVATYSLHLHGHCDAGYELCIIPCSTVCIHYFNKFITCKVYLKLYIACWFIQVV